MTQVVAPAPALQRLDQHGPIVTCASSCNSVHSAAMVRQETASYLNVQRSPRLPQRSKSLRVPKRVSTPRKLPHTQELLAVYQQESRERTGSFDSPSLRYGRGSLKQIRAKPRQDEWPQPTKPSYLEQKFLELPDEEYQRLRTFVIDPKGHVINRGDSFRLRTCTGDTDSSNSPPGSSRGASPRTVRDVEMPLPVDNQGGKPPQFPVLVLGMPGVGKSALVQQFKTAEHCNPFSHESEGNEEEQIVPVILHGQEVELLLTEKDSHKGGEWRHTSSSGFLLVYSVDSRATFRHALSLVSQIRAISSAPIILAGNKVDLARRRTIQLDEATTASKQEKCCHFEVSVALNHGIDQLLVALVSQVTDTKLPSRSSSKRENKVRAKASKSAPLSTRSALSAVGARVLNRILRGGTSKSCERITTK